VRLRRAIAAALVAALAAAGAVGAAGCHDDADHAGGLLRQQTATAAKPSRYVACRNADVVPQGSPASMRRAETALHCLLNQTRIRYRLKLLNPNRCLRKAALAHASDMVVRAYFAHDTPGGRDPGARARTAGYAPGRSRWVVGENLAWGTAPNGSPAWVQDNWMRSPTHRANVLRRDFRDVGVGAVSGAPPRAVRSTRNRPAVTYAAEFGVARGGRRSCR
jgi:uncharacterized protein YkwD